MKLMDFQVKSQNFSIGSRLATATAAMVVSLKCVIYVACGADAGSWYF